MRCEYEYVKVQYDISSNRVRLPSGEVAGLAEMGMAGWRLCVCVKERNRLEFAYTAMFERPLEADLR